MYRRKVGHAPERHLIRVPLECSHEKLPQLASLLAEINLQFMANIINLKAFLQSTPVPLDTPPPASQPETNRTEPASKLIMKMKISKAHEACLMAK